MFKKHLLAAAVLSLMSGAAFAENEAIIEQLDDASTASTATIEQVFTDPTQAHFAQAIQNLTDTATISIYQGATDTAGAIDPTGPASTAAQATAIDPTINAYADPLAYAPLTAAATSFALVKQDGAANAIGMIVQVTGDEVADLEDKTIDIGGVTAGISGGAINDGVVDVEPGVVSGTTDANNGNIAAIGQSAEVVDRGATVLGAGAQGDASDGELALIIQMGSGNIAQILQTGDAQAALVVQDDTNNDAYIAQFGGANNAATITQLASGDIGTILQTGDSNVARIYQHPTF
ncbi:curlin associated repeat protein [Fluviicoccus keumensis]|uniref:Curlin associated repeat protein n=1 Tax=Fluviicoccus keumensis TaxID=1435465 RepID=A0A4V2G615_9GAMM|nr:hypothetical protein [Fluviicoccus keumensis]RZU46956.1 curlin associated repeat protein [Fluviicoccus keumensis]